MELWGHQMIEFGTDQFNPLMDWANFPVVCVLRGKDGSVNHAVSFWNGWVYDANLEKAQPIKKDFLDWACASEYVGIHKGFRFYPKQIPIGFKLKQWTGEVNLVHAGMANLMWKIGEPEMGQKFEGHVHVKQKGFFKHVILILLQHGELKRISSQKLHQFRKHCENQHNLSIFMARRISDYELVSIVKCMDVVIVSDCGNTSSTVEGRLKRQEGFFWPC